MTSRPSLRVVDADEPSAETTLAQIVPELIKAEAVVARLKRLMDEERVRLAKERRVAFVREEHVRREFGLGESA